MGAYISAVLKVKTPFPGWQLPQRDTMFLNLILGYEIPLFAKCGYTFSQAAMITPQISSRSKYCFGGREDCFCCLSSTFRIQSAFDSTNASMVP